MPRRSRRSGGGSGFRPAATSRAFPRNPPKPAASAPPPSAPAPLQASAISDLGAAIADGLAFGTGNAVGHRVADAIMGPRVIRHETVTSSAPAAAPEQPLGSLGDACGGQTKAFQDCLNNYGSDISKCQFYMDMLHECRRSSETALGA